MAPGNVGIAVPDYEDYGIEGPYLGDRVFKYLDGEYPGKFEYIPERVKLGGDSTEETLTGENVRERVVYVIHPTMPQVQASTHKMIAQEVADDLLRSDASKVVLFDLYGRYYSYDKRKRRQSLNARIVAEDYENAGIRRVFTIEPHSEPLILAFSVRCPLEPLSILGHLGRAYMDRYSLRDTTVCSPDIGGYARAERVADFLDLPLVGIRKRRSQEKSDESEVIEIVGDRSLVEGNDILMVDDVIRGGGTACNAWKSLSDNYGARSCKMIVPHLELCGDAKDKIRESGIKLLGTNTVDHRFTEEEKKYIDVLDISEIIGKVIFRRSEGLSLKRFFKMDPHSGPVRMRKDV